MYVSVQSKPKQYDLLSDNFSEIIKLVKEYFVNKINEFFNDNDLLENSKLINELNWMHNLKVSYHLSNFNI
jgi:hypothetical protein